MFSINNFRIIVPGIVLACAAISSQAQQTAYTWTDEAGVVHFSDRPLEGQQAQAVQVSEFQLSETSDSSPAPEEQEALPSDTPVNVIPAEQEPVPLTAAQARREEMAKDREERREAQAENELMCQKHSKRVEQIEPYRRVYYTNEQGESVRMDDDLRIELVDESKAYIAENCD